MARAAGWWPQVTPSALCQRDDAAGMFLGGQGWEFPFFSQVSIQGHDIL